jgi:integrase
MDLTLNKIDQILTARNYSIATVKNYKYWVVKLIEHYRHHDLNKYTEKDIIEFLNHLKIVENNNHNSIRIAMSALSFAFNKVAKLNYDFRSVQVGKVENKERKPATQQQIIELIDSCDKLKYKIAFSLLYGTGMQSNELLAIKVRDINFTSKKIIINNKDKRRAKLPSSCIEDLKEHTKEYDSNDFIFQNKNKNKNDISSFRKKLKSISRQLNHEPEIQLKDFRTAYIKHLEEMNVPIHSILDELGLSKSPFARNYTINHYARIRDNSISVDYSPLDKKIKSKTKVKNSYISITKIRKMELINNTLYDFSKAIEILNQINQAYDSNMNFTVGILVRAFIDHIPPIFNCKNFAEVANNYNGTSSFKKLMKKLQDSLRNISDSFLHIQIRKNEELPSHNQVNFIPEMDALLSEIIRISKY